MRYDFDSFVTVQKLQIYLGVLKYRGGHVKILRGLMALIQGPKGRVFFFNIGRLRVLYREKKSGVLGLGRGVEIFGYF